MCMLQPSQEGMSQMSGTNTDFLLSYLVSDGRSVQSSDLFLLLYAFAHDLTRAAGIIV